MKSCMLVVAATLLCFVPSAYPQDVTWDLVRPSNTGIPGEEIRFARFANDGAVWVGARWPFWSEGGLGVLNVANDTWTTYSNAETGSGPGSIPSEFVNDIEFAADGSVWIATSGGLLRKVDQTWTVFNALNSPLIFDLVRSIALDSEGHVWINNDAALFEYDGENWRSFSVPNDIPWDDPWRGLTSVYVDEQDHVWVGNDTLSGLAEFDGQSWVIHGEGVAGFKRIVGDGDGNLWMTTLHLGYDFYKFDGTTFTRFSSNNTPFSQTTITEVAVDDNGDVFAGNWMGQIIKTTDGGNTWSTFVSGLNIVVEIETDPASDDVWIGTLGALGHFDGTGQWIKDYNSANTGQPDYFIDDLHLGRTSGKFYIASGEYGVSRFDGNRWVNRGSHNPNVNWPVLADGAWGVYEDRFGDVWIGTNGVARWTVEDDFDLWDWRNTSWGVTDFVNFAEDAQGNLFAFEEHGGAHRFHPQTQTWTEEPIFMYAVLGIPGAEADSQGNIYFGGWFDVARWDGATWTVLELPYNDFLYDLGGASDLDVAPDDTLWLGCPDGLVHFDGTEWTVYDASNTPMSVSSVTGVEVRSDGVIGLALSNLGDRDNCGAAIVDGDIDDPNSWHIYRYGETPMPHYQLGKAAFDDNGALWVSAISEAAAVIHYPVHEPPVTELISMDVGTGALLGGDVSDLVQSDDSYVHTRSGFGQTLVDLHHMEMTVRATTNVASPTTLDLTIEDRIDQPSGSGQIRLHNWTTGNFDLVRSYAIGPSDAIQTIENIEATNYVDATGAIEVSIKHLVFKPFLAFTFESFIDQVVIDVR